MSHAEALMAMLIRAGKIPGIGSCELVRAAVIQEQTGIPARIRMPVTYCHRCSVQLMFDWFAVNPVTDLELVCLFCGRLASERGEEVHTLIGRAL